MRIGAPALFLCCNLLIFLLFLASALQQGLLALREGKLAEAKSSFEQAVKEEPKNAFAWVSLAETYRRSGESSQAIDAAKKAEQFGAAIPAVDHALAAFYAQSGDFVQAAGWEEKYAASPKPDAEASLRAAELYERAGNSKAAERVLKALWERHAADPAVAFSYAQLLLQRLDFVGADKAVATALAAHPDEPQLVLVCGVARYGERRFDEAIDQFLKVTALAPAVPQPYAFLGKMLEQAGAKLPAIEKACAVRLKAAPGDAAVMLVLAKAKMQESPKDPEAEALLRHSIEIDSKQWEAHYELGVLLESRRDFKAAAGELNQAVSLNAKDPMPHYHLARVYDRLGDSERAQAERKIHEQLTSAQN